MVALKLTSQVYTCLPIDMFWLNLFDMHTGESFTACILALDVCMYHMHAPESLASMHSIR